MRGTLVLVLVLVLGSLPHAGAASSQTADYNMPSSFVVRGIFGVGKLLCSDDRVPSVLVDTVKNGPCFDYSGSEGRIFVIAASDEAWADTSITVAVDINGDGCVSDSCNGQPNDADYRISNCGPSMDILPFSDAAPVLQVFLRGMDVTPDLQVCGATSGIVILDIA